MCGGGFELPDKHRRYLGDRPSMFGHQQASAPLSPFKHTQSLHRVVCPLPDPTSPMAEAPCPTHTPCRREALGGRAAACDVPRLVLTVSKRCAG